MSKPTLVSTPESLLPLKPDVFTVLLVLLEGDAHGYAIMQRARERSVHRGQIQPGGLYRVLKRMLDDSLIQEIEIEPDAVAAGSRDERRRTYRVTDFGREVATAEARRMDALVAAARGHRLLRKAGS